jgi:hypothetical protein
MSKYSVLLYFSIAVYPEYHRRAMVKLENTAKRYIYS